MKKEPVNIVILSTIALYKGNSAGSSRMMKFAKAIAMFGNAYLFSYTPNCKAFPDTVEQVDENIFTNRCDPKKNRLNKVFSPVFLVRFLRSIIRYMNQRNGETVYYLYPSTEPLLDYFVFFYLILLKRSRVFYEANEVRKYIPKLQEKVSLFKQPRRFFQKYRSLAKYSLSEQLSRYFTGLVCISTNIEDYFRKYNSNIIRIPILTDSHEDIPEDPIAIHYDHGEPFKICFAGMISVKKENLIMFMDALNQVNLKFSNFQFNLYGQVSAEDRSLLLNYAGKYQLSDKIALKGKVSQQELISIYRAHNLLVLPRGYNLQNHFGFSTKLTEYLESGIPCLVTDVSDNGLFIKDNENGFIVKPDNPEAMAEKILQIIHEYNKIGPSISGNALTTVKERLNYEVYAPSLFQFFTAEKI